MSRRKDLDVIKTIIDDKKQKLGVVKRKPKNESGYIFGNDKSSRPTIHSIKSIGFNVKKFLNQTDHPGTPPLPEYFETEEYDIFTSYISAVNGNIFDGNVDQYENSMYVTELFTSIAKNISFDLYLESSTETLLAGSFAVYVNGTMFHQNSFGSTRNSITINLEGNKFTRIAIFLYNEGVNANFRIEGDIAMQIDSWRLPPPPAPRWKLNYPTNRNYRNQIELQWELDSIYSVGDTATTTIEYATASGGPFLELNHTPYGTKYFAHNALTYNSVYWYRLKTSDITANVSDYSNIKQGSTYFGNFPVISAIVKKDGIPWNYYASGDIMDIEVVSSTELSDIPECIIYNTIQSVTGEAVCYGSDELGMYNTYHYNVTENEQTTVLGISPNLFPEGIGTIQIRSNIFEEATNLLDNGNLEARYIQIPTVGDTYTEVSGWTRLFSGSAAEFPYYDYANTGGGLIGNRHLRVGGPYTPSYAAEEGNSAYEELGCQFYQEYATLASTQYTLSYYTRVADSYAVKYDVDVTSWNPRVKLEFYEFATGPPIISTINITGEGARDWTRTEHTFTTPLSTNRTRIKLFSQFLGNHICNGDFSDINNWWAISGIGNISYSTTGNTDCPTQQALYLSGNNTMYAHQLMNGVDDIQNKDMLASIWIMPIQRNVSQSFTFEYRDRNANTTFGSWIATGETFNTLVESWSRLSWAIPSGNIGVNAVGLGCRFNIPSGEWLITCAQLETGTSPAAWKPGNLQIDYDGIMLETGENASSSYRSKEDECGAYSIEADNYVYFDYTSPSGSFYISAINEASSNTLQKVTSSRNSFIIPTGINGKQYPYDEYGIRYIYIMNSGQGNPLLDGADIVLSGARFDYSMGASYSWTIDTTGWGPAGTGTGIRQVYAMFEDMAGNTSNVINDTIIYVTDGLPSPSGLSATGNIPSVNTIAWLPITGSDDPYELLAGYEVYSWDVETSVYDTQLSIWNASTHNISGLHAGLEPAKTYHYSVRAKDVSGQHSDWATYATCTSYGYNDDVSPAGPFVSGLNSSGANNLGGGWNVWIDAELGHSGLNSNGTNCIDLHILECALRKSGEDSYVTQSYAWSVPPSSFPTGMNFRFNGLEANTQYYISGRAIDLAGNPSEWCSESGVLSAIDLDHPNTIGWFTQNGLFEKVVLNWELMDDWGAKQFILLRGDYNRVTTSVSTEAAAISDTIALDSVVGISGNYMIVIDPTKAAEGRYLIKSVDGGSKEVEIYGKTWTTHSGSSPVVVYTALAQPYRGPYTDTDCDIQTTYYYNVLAMDMRYNISEAYGTTNLTNTGHQEWPSATTKGIEEVDVAWDFLSDITTINKIRNSSFEIQSGGESTIALFWDRIGGGSFREAFGSAPYGGYVAGLSSIGHIIQSEPFPVESGTDYVFSFYAYNDTGPATDKIKGRFQYWTGSTWADSIEIIDTSSAIQTWERFSDTGSTPAVAVSGRVLLYGDTSDVNYDGVMVQRGSWLSQYIPYSDEFVLGTEMITTTEITSGAITSPLIAANAIQAQHIFAGAIGTHHLTVANRKIDASELHFYPNRNTPLTYWNTDTSADDWPVGDSTWNPASIFWTSGTIQYQSGSTIVGTNNYWVQQVLDSGNFDGSYDNTYYLVLKYQTTIASGEPLDSGTTVMEVFDAIEAASVDPPAGYGRTFIGVFKTGTSNDDADGATYESVGTQGTTIVGNQIKTHGIEARMIVAGAVHAGHVSANEITGTHISGESIDVGHIKVGARARAYGHNAHFYPTYQPPTWDTIYANAFEFWTTGETYNISAGHNVYYPGCNANTIYYLYYDTSTETLWYTGESFAEQLVSGTKYPLATFRYTTDGGGENEFEISHIRAWGTYLDGSHISASSITATEIHADAINAIHIEAETITGGHIYGGGFTGLWYHASIPNNSGDLWINSGGDSGDIRVYDGDEKIRVEFGLDVANSFPEVPSNWYGTRINNGLLFINSSGGDLDISDWGGILGNLPHPASFINRFEDEENVWAANSGDSMYLSWNHATFDYKSNNATTTYVPWVGHLTHLYNNYGPILSAPYYAAGVYGNVTNVYGDGYANAHHDYGAGTFDTFFIAHRHAVVGIHGHAHGTLPGTNYRGGDIVGGVFRGAANYLSAINTSTHAIGILATAYCGNDSSRAIALWTYGNINTHGSRASGSKVMSSGIDYYSVDGLTKLGFEGSGEFSQVNLISAGHVSIGGAKITQENNIIYIESGMKIPSGETIYVGDKEITQIGDVLSLGAGAYVDPSKGILPTGDNMTLGAPYVGEEWYGLYLNSGGGTQPGIYWNFSDVSATKYGTIFSRNDGVQSRMQLVQYYNGTNAKILLDAKNDYVEFTTAQIRPGTDNTTDLGLAGTEFKDLYLDGTAYIDKLEADISFLPTITGVDYVDFAINSSPSCVERRLYWDDDRGGLEVGMKGGTSRLSVGQEQLIRVKAGENIIDGQVVYISGAIGQNPVVGLGIATEHTKSNLIGMAIENINSGQVGYITTFGVVRELDTSTFSDGDRIYLSSSVSGGYTATKPDNTDYYVTDVGFILYSHATEGKLFVNTTGPVVADDITGNIAAYSVSGGSANITSLETSSNATINGDLTVTGELNTWISTYYGIKNIVNDTADRWQHLPGGQGMQMSADVSPTLSIPMVADGFIKSITCQLNLDSFVAGATMAMDLYLNEVETITDCIETTLVTGVNAWTTTYEPNEHPIAQHDRIVFRLDVTGVVQYDYSSYTLVVQHSG